MRLISCHQCEWGTLITGEAVHVWWAGSLWEVSVPSPQFCSKRIKPKLKNQILEEIRCGGSHHISIKFTCLASAKNKEGREKMDEGNTYRQRASQGRPEPGAPGVWWRLACGALPSTPSSRPSLPCLRTMLLSAGRMAAPDNASVLFPGVCEHAVLHGKGRKDWRQN